MKMCEDAKTERQDGAARRDNRRKPLSDCLLVPIQIVCFARKQDEEAERRSPGSGGSRGALSVREVGVSGAPPGRLKANRKHAGDLSGGRRNHLPVVVDS